MRSLPLVFLFAAFAHADPAPPVFDARLIEMIPATGIVGDPTQAADLYVLALNADGSPVAGMQLKPLLNTGSATDPTDLGGGLWKMVYTPPKVDTSVPATLTLKGKIGKENYTGSWTFPVAPPRTHQMAATANPSRMTLGVDKTASLSFRLISGDGVHDTNAQLTIAATCGTVQNLTNLGGGQFSALYTPPTTPTAQVALITAADQRDPGRSLAVLAIPLTAKIDVPVKVAPRAQVLLKIGDQQFGPVPSDSKGNAKVPVLLLPGASMADKISVGADGTSVSEPLDLKVAEARRIALVPTAAGIPGDARLAVPVHAAVVTPDGRPDTSAQVAFSVSAGSVGPAKHEGNGLYTAVFTPPNAPLAQPVTLTAALADRPTQIASARLSILALRPAGIAISPTPATLAKEAPSLAVSVNVTGPDGSGLPGRALDLAAAGAKLKDAVKDAGKGLYTATFTPTGHGPVNVMASVPLPVSGNPLWRVLLVPSVTHLTTDGLSSSQITVATVDEFGYPVPDVVVELHVTAGDGSLPVEARTNAAGIAHVYYTAGRKAGLVEISATSGPQAAVTSLLQVPEEYTAPEVPVAGSRAEAALVAEWRKASVEFLVGREE